MKTQTANRLSISFKKTIGTFINVLPIIIGMLLATSLVITVFPEQISTGLFGNGDVPDALLGASIGSIAVGHPLASYLLGGELLGGGVGLVAVTALLVSWVPLSLFWARWLERSGAVRACTWIWLYWMALSRG